MTDGFSRAFVESVLADLSRYLDNVEFEIGSTEIKTDTSLKTRSITLRFPDHFRAIITLMERVEK